MGNIFNDDFRDFIEILNKYKVKYILVGGYAVILHDIGAQLAIWMYG
jgi:hypothetical protein